MESTFLRHESLYSLFVQLNNYACTGCWKCIKVCPNKVIDKSFLFIGGTLITEHVLIYNARKCTGCFKCIQACTFDAISIYNHQIKE